MQHEIRVGCGGSLVQVEKGKSCSVAKWNVLHRRLAPCVLVDKLCRVPSGRDWLRWRICLSSIHSLHKCIPLHRKTKYLYVETDLGKLEIPLPCVVWIKPALKSCLRLNNEIQVKSACLVERGLEFSIHGLLESCLYRMCLKY